MRGHGVGVSPAVGLTEHDQLLLTRAAFSSCLEKKDTGVDWTLCNLLQWDHFFNQSHLGRDKEVMLLTELTISLKA